MKFLLCAVLLVVALSAASAGYIRSGWNNGYSGYGGGWNNGYSGYGGGWNNGYSGYSGYSSPLVVSRGYGGWNNGWNNGWARGGW